MLCPEGRESSLQVCEPKEVSNCDCPVEDQGTHLQITCNKGKFFLTKEIVIIQQCLHKVCTDEEKRLVGGSTHREGRVEMCTNGRWGTVCNNSQEGIAGTVCSQLGFPAEKVYTHHVLYLIDVV